jgi:cell division protein FtsQ
VVDVVEVQPVAEWGNHQWLNFTGDLVQREDLPGEPDLPVLSGPDNQKKEVWQAFQRWSSMFGSNGLTLDELRLDTRGLWYLKLSLGALALDRRSSSPDGAVLTGLSTVESEKNELAVDASALVKKQAAEPVTMTVKQEHADERVKRFVDALNHQLIVEFPGMRSIDLRYPNGFAISWKNSLPQAHSLTETQ